MPSSFEYLGAQRPILGIGPSQEDAAKVLQKTGAGKMHDYDDLSGLKSTIQSYFQAYQAGNLVVRSEQIDQFSRRTLAGDFCKLLEDLNEKRPASS